MEWGAAGRDYSKKKKRDAQDAGERILMTRQQTKSNVLRVKTEKMLLDLAIRILELKESSSVDSR